MRNNRYRLPAKFYIILWTSMWAAAVGMFVMAFLQALDLFAAQHQGPGPQCGAQAVGRFYRFVAPKMFVSMLPCPPVRSHPSVVSLLPPAIRI
jgi:hypothetical protein